VAAIAATHECALQNTHLCAKALVLRQTLLAWRLRCSQRDLERALEEAGFINMQGKK